MGKFRSAMRKHEKFMWESLTNSFSGVGSRSCCAVLSLFVLSKTFTGISHSRHADSFSRTCAA